MSDVDELFEGQSFATWKKAKEHEVKLQLAIINRLDGLAKAIQSLGKSR